MPRSPARFLICLLAAAASTACRAKAPEQIPVVDVALGDFFFHGPDTIPAGTVTFRLNVMGPHAHVMDLFLLTQDKRLKDLMAVGEDALDSSWVKPVGGGVSGTEGSSPSYTLQLVPGRYVMLCYFGDSLHVPHYAHGMVKEFIVAGPARSVAAVAPDLEVRTVDYDYTFSTPITAGHRTLRVINPMQQGHEMIMVRLKEGYTMEQARAWEDSTATKGPSPWERFGGVGDLSPGDTIVMSADFRPGTYNLYCYFKNKGNPKNHYDMGMNKYITVN